MALNSEIFYLWSLAADLIGLIGFLAGYWKIEKSLSGAVAGFVLFKVLQYVAVYVLLGVIIQ